MDKLLCCDWGTSNFRLRLVEIATGNILEEVRSAQGIAETFKHWKQTGRSEEYRLGYYLTFIAAQLEVLAGKTANSLAGVPVILSGMASSSIGMVELAYNYFPPTLDGTGLNVLSLPAAGAFTHPVLLVSGLRTATDIMRGEETKLIGCARQLMQSDPTTYIFPGTHSKHVLVNCGQVIQLTTYMTGEFFDLLSQKSILAPSVAFCEKSDAPNLSAAFAEGVLDSVASSLLHSAFVVRINDLFKTRSATENYQYLSGVLIGSELKELRNRPTHICVVGHHTLTNQYCTALNILGIPSPAYTLCIRDADEALIAGQLHIYKTYYQLDQA